MPTRRTTDPNLSAHERFMSSPEFAERRAIPGNLIAEKSSLYSERRHREMLMFLQIESSKDGGMKQLARTLLVRFPERLGSPSMHRAGMSPGVVFEAETMRRVREELRLEEWETAYMAAKNGSTYWHIIHGGSAGNFDYSTYEEMPGDEVLSSAAPESAEYLLQVCRRQARNLDTFLRDFCLDPSLDLEQIEAADWSAEARYFTGIYSALAQLKKEEEDGDSFDVVTQNGREINSTLDFALRTRGMVIIEGEPSYGKSTAVATWARRHPGQARYVTLTGVMHKTGLFQAIADSIGLATCQRKSCELQAKIESFFGRTKMMLCIDEAHYLWPATVRVTTEPVLINWINTALVNKGVPVALVCTDQFLKLKERVEKQTGWSDGQFKHRVKRFMHLENRPTVEDMWAVARRLLLMRWDASAEKWISDPNRTADKLSTDAIVGYAMASHFPLRAIGDSIDEARDIALCEGRSVISLRDVKTAILEHQAKSDAAIKKAWDLEKSGRRTGAHGGHPKAPHKKSRIRVSEAASATVAPDPATPLPASDRAPSAILNSRDRGASGAALLS